MTFEELTPEAAALLSSLVSRPHAVEEGSLLQLLMADRLVMGSTNKVHVTGLGKRLLMQKMAVELLASTPD